MAALTRDQIIGARNAKIKKVYIDALDGDVYIREISISETDQYVRESEDLTENQSTMLYASFLIGEQDGSRMFTEYGDLGSLATKAIFQIVEEGNRLNGVSDEEVEETAKK